MSRAKQSPEQLTLGRCSSLDGNNNPALLNKRQISHPRSPSMLSHQAPCQPQQRQ